MKLPFLRVPRLFDLTPVLGRLLDLFLKSAQALGCSFFAQVFVTMSTPGSADLTLLGKGSVARTLELPNSWFSSGPGIRCSQADGSTSLRNAAVPGALRTGLWGLCRVRG